MALAEMALAGGLGFEYDEVMLERMIAGPGRGRADVALFGEGAGKIIVAVPWERWDELQDALTEAPGYDEIGTIGGDRFRIGDLIDVKLEDLKEAHDRDLFP